MSSVVSAPLARTAAHLRCPVCSGPLVSTRRTLRCGRGHSSMCRVTGMWRSCHRVDAAPPATTPPWWLRARRSWTLQVLAPLTAALVRTALDVTCDRAPTVLDVGAGTGHHLAAVLDALPGADGIAFDASRAALRRAGRAHPRIAAVAGDVWREIPLLDATAKLVMNVFAPRNPPSSPAW